MGKGVILDEIGDGRYIVSVEMHRNNLEARIARFLLDISNLSTLYDEVLIRIDAAQVALEAAADAYNAAIEVYNSLPPDERDLSTLEEHVIALAAADAEYQEAAATASTIAAQRASIVLSLASINAIPPDPLAEVICVDGETEITGEVGMIEIAHEAAALPGEDGSRIRTWIKPGFLGAAAYDGVTDGVLAWRQAEAQSPEQVYVNAALLPGVQKWRPTYRTGRILTIRANDRCDLVLDNVINSSPSVIFDVNQEAYLNDVPIRYRDCNADAFQINDHVVVQFFQSWSAPQVIGFVEDPRPCSLNIWLHAYASFFYPGSIIADSTNEVAEKFTGSLSSSTGVSRGLTFFGPRLVGLRTLKNACIADGVACYIGREYRFLLGYNAASVRLPSASIFFNVEDPGPTQDYWPSAIAVTETEAFLLRVKVSFTETPSFVNVEVYTHNGSQKRIFPLPYDLGWSHGNDPYAPGDAGRNTLIALGGSASTGPVAHQESTRLLLLAPLRGSEMHMLVFMTDTGGVVWSREVGSGLSNVGLSMDAGVDYVFHTHSFSAATQPFVFQRRISDGALLRAINVAAHSPGEPEEWIMGQVAYTHDKLYVTGYAHGQLIYGQTADPVVLRFRVGRQDGIPVFEGWHHFNELLGGPPPIPNEEFTNNWYSPALLTDYVLSFKRGQQKGLPGWW